jgi:hypothetical protein
MVVTMFNIVPFFSDQSEYVVHLFLVSYWLNEFLFPISNGGRRSSTGVTGKWPVSQFPLSRGFRRNPPMLVWNYVAALSVFLLGLEVHPATAAGRKVEIRRQLLSKEKHLEWVVEELLEVAG